MLEPERRHLLLDAMRPPPGFTLDLAIGTTYTLDLVALLVAPVAFALFDVESEDGTPLGNPIAVLEAVRRHAGSITIYCQAGNTFPPSQHRAAFAYLEESVVPVAAPRGGIFHPKVWAIRFRGPADARRYRFLCQSRNLTFDRSWDTILRLDGEPSVAEDPRNAPLRTFFAALPAMATGVLAPARAAATIALANELAAVRWEQPSDELVLDHFWPLGLPGPDAWPFRDDHQRTLIVSPFVDAQIVERLCRGRANNVLVSRPETLDRLGKPGVASVGRTCVLHSNAAIGAAADGDGAEPDQRQSIELEGLHAKLFVLDRPWQSRIWTGSANATAAAFSRNVEFLVELRARAPDAISGLADPGPPGQTRLGNLLEDYEPPETPVEETEAERADMALDALARTLGCLCFRADVTEAADGLFDVVLRGVGPVPRPAPDGVTVAVRPMTTGAASRVTPTWTPMGLEARFRTTFLGLTAFFTFDLTTMAGGTTVSKSFLATARLSGAPEDRMERLLVSELRTRADLVRLLLLLLGTLDPRWGDLFDLVQGDPHAEWGTGQLLGSDALLEPLLHCLSREPERLDEIERLVRELARTQEGQALLPEGWAGLWRSVSAARPRAGASR